MDYCTIDDLKAPLAIPLDDTASDAQLHMAVTAASSIVDRYCGQTFAAPVPVAVQMAAMLQALRLFKRPGSPFGISGSPDLQGEIRLLARIDPDVQVLLAGYRSMGVVG